MMPHGVGLERQTHSIVSFAEYEVCGLWRDCAWLFNGGSLPL